MEDHRTRIDSSYAHAYVLFATNVSTASTIKSPHAIGRQNSSGRSVPAAGAVVLVPGVGIGQRGHHFFGPVGTTSVKLFNLVRPDVAVFGKKDRQQLKIVRGMMQQFNLPIRIVPAETVRAEDGLALASRNSYLSPQERDEAPRLYRTLSWVADQILAGRHDYANLEAAARADLSRHGSKVDYIAIRHGLALRVPHPEGYDHPNLLIVLGAAMLGTTRLIDNVDVVQGASED